MEKTSFYDLQDSDLLEQFNSLDKEIATENIVRMADSEREIEITVGLNKGIKMSYKNSTLQKLFITLQKNKNNMSFFTKITQDFESLKTKIAGASARVEGYIETGLKLGNELENFVHSGVGRLVIPEVLKKIGVTDPAMQEDIINAIPKALGYATQAQTILGLETPEDQLNAFLQDIANDAPGTQIAKIDGVITGIIANLDNNSLLPQIYTWLFGHSKTVAAVTAQPIPQYVAAPEAVEQPAAEITPEGANA